MDRSPLPDDQPSTQPAAPAPGPAPPQDDLQTRLRQLADLQLELNRTGFGSNIEAMQMLLIQRTAEIMQTETCALTLIDEGGDGWLITRAIWDGEHLPEDPSAWVYQVNSNEGSGLVRTCIRLEQMILSEQGEADERYDPESDGLGDLQVRSMLCAPLVAGGRVLGALRASNKPGAGFDASDQAILTAIAGLAANAVHGARLIQQLTITNADLEASRWELLGSRNTLRAVFDNLPTGIYIIDSGYKLTAINIARAHRVGLAPRNLVGRICYEALFNRQTPCEECRVLETLYEGIGTVRSERRYVVDDVYEWEISSHPIFDENNRPVQAILFEQDHSERRRLEAILTQSEKLAAIGQLAAGVAHEINNPLTAIIANAQILRRELPPNSELQESVDLIARAGARATQVIRNLLDFARKEEVHLGLTNLNDTIERALDLVRHELLARGIHLVFTPDPELPPVLASTDHLQSVWLNLLLNAIDSLDKNPAEIKIASSLHGSDIQVTVADNGVGIPMDRLSRIFEPFYTTKAPGRGTGLGLSVSHRIVKQHGGRINVESQVGLGSVFTVSLPIT